MAYSKDFLISRSDPERYSYFACILYLENYENEETLFKMLNDMLIPMAVSPLHEPDNENLKPHYHLIVDFRSMKSAKQIYQVTDFLNSSSPVKINKNAYFDYLTHLHAPEKQQFPGIRPTLMNGYCLPEDSACYSDFEIIFYLLDILVSNGCYNVFDGMYLMNKLNLSMSDKNCYVKYMRHLKELLYWAEKKGGNTYHD